MDFLWKGFTLAASAWALSALAVVEVKNLENLTVEICTDGDTCRLTTSTGETLKIRLIAIDAPEITGKKGKPKQPLSVESKEFLNQSLKGKKVTVRSFGTDMYQRVLGEILVEGTNVNLEMVKQGFAEVYMGKVSQKGLDMASYEEAQTQAKQSKKGIWSLVNYQSPMHFRKSNK
jgi:micrococcal nuclease